MIQQLIQVVHDEKVYMEGLPNQSDYTIHQHLLLIPPSSWERLLPLLTRAPLVKLAYDGNTFDGICLSDEPIPLQFDLLESGGQRLSTEDQRVKSDDCVEFI